MLFLSLSKSHSSASHSKPVRQAFHCLLVALSLCLAACGGDTLLTDDGSRPEADSGVETPDTGPTFEDSGGIGRAGIELARVVPDHGPFTGGNTVILRGNGFTDNAQVTFGGRNVQPADHQLIDARRLAVVVPAGEPGTVDVTITIEDATVTLENGYTYDAIVVSPNSGSVAGNTLVEITSTGVDFEATDEVLFGIDAFGRNVCSDVNLVAPNRITCRTPPMAAGTVSVTINRGSDALVTAEDAYSYFDSSDPSSGGLGGGEIAGTVNLTVINAGTGGAVPGAFAIIGEDLSTEHQGLTDSLGQITFSGPDVIGPATIHVAAFCFEKTSVVFFDSRDVTVFLIPWMDPMCGEGSGEPPTGRGRNGAFISGELVWSQDIGLGVQPWYNVPEPREGWERVAYVYTTQVEVDIPNPDPASGGAFQRVLEVIDPEAENGYPYSIFARPAGLAVYALAGLENRTTMQFMPYVMGVARNVLAGPGDNISGINIEMTIPLDHYVEVELTDLPMATDSGPDNFRLQANIDLGGEGYIVRNVMETDLDVLRSRSGSSPFRFVAQPALERELYDGRYRIQAGWYTTQYDLAPSTIAVEQGVTAVDSTVRIGNFLGIPQATAPASGERIPEDRVLRWTADGPDPDMHIVLINGADGNPAWRMFVRGDVREVPIPDLSSIPEIDDMPEGVFFWSIYAVAIPGFDFDEFRYSYLSDRYWSRWAMESFTAQR